jgi:hypothetical protein
MLLLLLPHGHLEIRCEREICESRTQWDQLTLNSVSDSFGFREILNEPVGAGRDTEDGVRLTGR